jgi:hypothetical protein
MCTIGSGPANDHQTSEVGGSTARVCPRFRLKSRIFPCMFCKLAVFAAMRQLGQGARLQLGIVPRENPSSNKNRAATVSLPNLLCCPRVRNWRDHADQPVYH